MNNEKKLCGAFSSHRIGPCGLVIGHEGLHEVSFRGGMARWNELQCLSQETSKPADLQLDAVKILSANAAQELVNYIKQQKSDHVAEVERLTKHVELLNGNNRLGQEAMKAGEAKLQGYKARAELAESKLSQLQQQIYKYENDEASCCPEDVGFVEFISVQRKKIESLQLANEEKARKIWEADWGATREDFIALAVAILNGGQQ